MDKVAAGIGYSRGHLSRLANSDNNEDGSSEVEELLVTKYSDLLQDVTLSSPDRRQGFSAEELYAMFMRVTEMQTGILRSIESKMARADAQARIETNSIEILAGVKTLSIRQKQAIAENKKDLSELKSQNGSPNRGSSKKSGQIDGVGNGRGKKPRAGN